MEEKIPIIISVSIITRKHFLPLILIDALNDQLFPCKLISFNVLVIHIDLFV